MKNKLNRVLTGFFMVTLATLAISCSSKKDTVAAEPAVAPAQTEQKVTETQQQTTTTTKQENTNLGASSSGRGF